MGAPFPVSYGLSWPLRYLRPSTRRLEPFDRAAPSWESAVAGSAEAPAVHLAFLGDLMCIASDRAPAVDPALRALVGAADHVVVNCESPIIGERCHPAAGHRYFRHDMPADFVRGVLDALGAEPARCLFTLANNHVGDHGTVGLERTLEACRRLGTGVVGVKTGGGPPLTIVAHHGLRLGFAAWTHWLNRDPWAGRGPVGRAADAVGTPWGRLRQEAALDTLIGLPHWDWEFRHFPRPSTRAFARGLTGQGFDLLVGCHPHVLQPVERLGSALCFYSHGSLLGPSMPFGCWPARLGALVEVTLRPATAGAAVAAYEVHPFVQVRRRGTVCLALLSSLSAPRPVRYKRRFEQITGKA